MIDEIEIEAAKRQLPRPRTEFSVCFVRALYPNLFPASVTYNTLLHSSNYLQRALGNLKKPADLDAIGATLPEIHRLERENLILTQRAQMAGTIIASLLQIALIATTVITSIANRNFLSFALLTTSFVLGAIGFSATFHERPRS